MLAMVFVLKVTALMLKQGYKPLVQAFHAGLQNRQVVNLQRTSVAQILSTSSQDESKYNLVVKGI